MTAIDVLKELNLLNPTVVKPSRPEKLHKIAKDYVLNGLGAKNFDAIPYDEYVVLRAIMFGRFRVPFNR